ncbi:MAG: hypothetical protein ACLR4Z_05700 [Butyricicoccaceae bacterium]
MIKTPLRCATPRRAKVLFTSAEGLEQLAIRPNSRLTWFKGL